MNKYISTPTVMLAYGLGLSINDTCALLNGEEKVTPELSKKLTNYFGMSALFFFRLQKDIDSRQSRFAFTLNEPAKELALAYPPVDTYTIRFPQYDQGGSAYMILYFLPALFISTVPV